MNNIKVICLDLDGTLLTKDRTISDANMEALRACIKKGIHIYIVTGRPYCFAKMIANKIHPSTNVIASNGAIYEVDKDIFTFPMKDSALPNIIDVCQKYDLHAFFKSKHRFYTHDEYDYRFLYDHMNEEFTPDIQVQSMVNLSWDELKNKATNILKVLVFSTEEKLSKARKTLASQTDITITDYQKISFDITANSIDKGFALQSVCHAFGWQKEEVMAFGDGHNDLEMFEQSGLRIAMENAEEILKQNSDDITDHYLKDGVAKAIHKYILVK